MVVEQTDGKVRKQELQVQAVGVLKVELSDSIYKVSRDEENVQNLQELEFKAKSRLGVVFFGRILY